MQGNIKVCIETGTCEIKMMLVLVKEQKKNNTEPNSQFEKKHNVKKKSFAFVVFTCQFGYQLKKIM